MRIAIDIDDTLTEVKDKILREGLEYAHSLGKIVSQDYPHVKGYNNDGRAFKKMFNFNDKELKYFLGPLQEKITNNAKPRKNAVEIIKKLKDDGNEIIILTARDNEFHKNPYKMSKDWLDKNEFVYDKLIVNARNKKKICKQEKIDLLIDDNLFNCLEVKEITQVIRISKDNSNDILTFSNWDDIYNYINKKS
ncbi:MAG TPA: hypothetical protein PLV83_04960 [Bacilli bacterium]|nr:hypothetical protein [Bacilli bacterium]